jgi:hypothetical protein
MTMGRILSRAITQEEIEVVRTALDRAATTSELGRLASGVEQLRVISRCGCGCASVDFVEHDSQNPGRPIAHAIGSTETAGMVGVIIWGTAEQITGLEVYDLGAGPHDLTLPVPASIEVFPSNRPKA